MAFPLLSLIPFAEKLIERIFPDPTQAADAKLKLLEMQQTGELAQLAADTDLAKGQMAINAVEAASEDKFTRRWRPFIGWVCGAAFAYNLIIQPFMVFMLVACDVVFRAADLPIVDGDLLGWALGGMLGLGTMRTVEKTVGTKIAK
jgi:hypothetical protein